MTAEAPNAIGTEAVPTFLRDCWYMATHSSKVKKAGLKHEKILGEPVLIGRDRNGKAFAHARHLSASRRAAVGRTHARTTIRSSVPITAGASRPTACALHSLAGRRSGSWIATNVRCAPSVREQDGLIWIYMPAPGRENAAPSSEPPKVGVPNAKPRWVESQTFACGIDHAVIGLMDPAHAPYVHGRWWWR